jgi:hypothetical protein
VAVAALVGLVAAIAILVLILKPGQNLTPASRTLARAATLTSSRIEITGGSVRTWSDYTTAGGNSGPSIPPHARILVTCRIRGFPVKDTNPWWYLIASPQWHKRFFASADGFYNRPGESTGSLLNTRFVDGAVRVCP